ncbi:MAG: hypothetical protein IKX42_07780 [Fibrobacter sp.]|nr:hypothetical protein [Fibrobacter sp.]MBR5693578.1 hypothetical protein [Fibrobacter sp.]
MKIILLCIALLIAPCLAQEPNVTAPVDSVAYYDSLADYNYKKFRTDETLSEVFFWTSVGLTVASPILVFAAAGVADCYGFEGCQDGSLALNIAAISTTLLVLPSWITYGAFRTAKFIRQKKYNEYYGRKEELKRQRVQAVPLLNPVDGRYGVALAFSI